MLRRTKEYVNDMWWTLLLTGAVSILFGMATLFMPGLTLVLLVTLFAVFIVVMGVIELVQGLSDIKKNDQWWVSVVLGLVLLGLGAYLTSNLDITAAAFVVLLGWALVARGVFDVIVGLTVHKAAEMKVFRVIIGVLGVIAGIIIWMYPASGSLTFTWVLGLYALVSGSLMLGEALATRALLDGSEKRR